MHESMGKTKEILSEKMGTVALGRKVAQNREPQEEEFQKQNC